MREVIKLEASETFLNRFYTHASKQDKCLLAWPNSPLDAKINPNRIYWEQQRNDDLRLIRMIIIDYISDDVKNILKGSGGGIYGRK